MIAADLQKKLYMGIEDGNFQVMGAPPVRGLGTTGGFKIMIEDRGNNGLAALQDQTDNLVRLGNQLENRQPGLTRLMSVFRANTPQLYVDIDRTKCKTMGVALNDVFGTLQIDLGGLYVNDFNQFGPHLAGERPGRRRLSHATRRRGPLAGPKQSR